MHIENTTATWQPSVVIDLDDITPVRFAEAVERFQRESISLSSIPTGMTDGWHTVTPQIAENLLRHNVAGANRKISLATVKYYARQMETDEWKQTGQPLIIAANDTLIDGQHRLWASYLSGKAFNTYVVTNIPKFENLFAYIDNGKSRSAKDALSTAGVNGLSSVIGQVVRLARFYDARAFGVLKNKYVVRPTPAEILRYAEANPSLAEAAHVQIGEYKPATKLIGYPDIAVFAAWKILDGYGGEVLDDFMSELGSSEPLEDGNAIILLRKKLADDRGSTEPMPKRHVLAWVTKVFNAWRLKQPVRRMALKTDEQWPLFVDTSVDAEAA